MFAAIADQCVPGAAYKDLLRVAIERGLQQPGDTDQDDWLDKVSANLPVAGDRLFELRTGRWLEARARRTADGGSLIVFSDVTERKRAEEALSMLNRNLALLAATDGLTNLMNRRMFDQAFEREFARARRDRTPLSLLLIDVDRFKGFNDTYGHPAGDQCLLAISACLTMGLKRSGDIVARYGGEEFAAILPNTGLEGALQLSKDLCQAVRGRNIPHRASEKSVVTISIGLAAINFDRPAGRSQDLLREADQALYAAKAAGRDCVMTVADGASTDRRRQLAG